jgi:hypothetical protein
MVRGFPEGEAIADDAFLVVELDIGEGSNGLADVVDGAARRGGQVLDADRLSVGEEAEEWTVKPPMGSRLVVRGSRVGTSSIPMSSLQFRSFPAHASIRIARYM